jgi:hypothetical protein
MVMILSSNRRGCGLIAQSGSTSESSSYCLLQYWNGTIPMSQWGCANSPFTQTVESTFVGNQVSATGSGGTSMPGSMQTTSQSGSSPTDTASSGSSSSSSPSLSTSEIIGIAIGSVIALLIIVLAIKQLIYPHISPRPKHPDSSPSRGFPLQPTNHHHPAGPPPPPGPHIINNNFYGHSTSPTLNNPSQHSHEHFRTSPHALSRENMYRLQSGYSGRGSRTVGSESNDGYSDVDDRRDFSHSQRRHYGGPHVPPSVISAAPRHLPPV